ncbi:GNAT family N-acetyltransferase [Acetanaerobacterium elongatum]|uniref:Ribosomal protein S18 acetylase RimI n=1 Tax=Acetanaerobacterium elongatum TaxID=258515 RepID=A0A1H0AIG1_9FIRM|nr:GNAT family N-acetyltransferase [Acetanaerobacterium elongatum]SDN33320.1 Ribosomal protein S18 acetylase RimI [Acetanaerobacterium elongatum]
MYQIRKAVPDDALGIALVKVYTWKTTYTGLIPDNIIDELILAIKAQAERFSNDITLYNNATVAAVENTIVGFCVYGKSRNEDFPDAGEIYALYVLKGFQGMGLGEALFGAAIDELLFQGNNFMIINCLKGNPSLDFYKHMGGKVVGQRQDEIAGASITEDIVLYDNLPQLRKKRRQ